MIMQAWAIHFSDEQKLYYFIIALSESPYINSPRIEKWSLNKEDSYYHQGNAMNTYHSGLKKIRQKVNLKMPTGQSGCT